MWPAVERPANNGRWVPIANPFVKYVRSRVGELEWPNGGLLMGTSDGLLEIFEEMRRVETFPCCPAAVYGREDARFALPPCRSCADRHSKRPACAVSSQACLHSSLLAARGKPKLASRRVAIDENASLFLSTYGLEAGELDLDASSRLRYVPTGRTPCVLHLNGKRSPEKLHLFRVGAKSRVTWVPSRQVAMASPGWLKLAGGG